MTLHLMDEDEDADDEGGFAEEEVGTSGQQAAEDEHTDLYITDSDDDQALGQGEISPAHEADVDEVVAHYEGPLNPEPVNVMAAYLGSRDGKAGEQIELWDLRKYRRHFPIPLSAHRGDRRKRFKIKSDNPHYVEPLASTLTRLFLTYNELFNFGDEYRFSNDIFLILPARKKRANQPPEGMVAINSGMLDAGLTFPMHPSVGLLLKRWNLSPHQVMPPRWYYIVGTMVILAKYGLGRWPTAKELANVFFHSKAERQGHYSVKSKGLILGAPNKIKDWHLNWFFVWGAWCPRRRDGREINVPFHFNSALKEKPSKDLDPAFVTLVKEIKKLPAQ